MYIGEAISLAVAVSWTATAMFAEVASKRMGSVALNVVRMVLSLTMLSIALWLTVGVPYPPFADADTWLWLCLSGFVGYVLGDYCLFQCYYYTNSRFGQLFMTLASPSAAIAAWVLLSEHMQPLTIVGMLITMVGIGMSILTRSEKEEGSGHQLSLNLPLKGVLFGIGAGAGQGVGLVLSKVGMQYYENSILASGIEDMTTYVSPDALIPVSLGFVMPFASTMIRAVLGLLGFLFTITFLSRKSWQKLRNGLSDPIAMRCTLGAAFFGPFLGVGLSLMATLYTNAGIAQTIMATTPVMIILPSWLIFKQKITLPQVIGAIISVIGVSLFFI